VNAECTLVDVRDNINWFVVLAFCVLTQSALLLWNQWKLWHLLESYREATTAAAIYRTQAEECAAQSYPFLEDEGAKYSYE
jgi:hypothetical protein